jgi:hypothetical protein
LIFKRFSVNIKVSERERKEREDKKINRNWITINMTIIATLLASPPPYASNNMVVACFGHWTTLHALSIRRREHQCMRSRRKQIFLFYNILIYLITKQSLRASPYGKDKNIFSN